MLTHVIQSKEVSLFLIDEPDIYLHSDLQRQLLGLLRNLGPDILLATHSTEIITEAETNDIVLINKQRQSARRIKDPSQLQEVFGILGSNMNPILTQLAKTRRVLFVEGKDFQIFSKFARKLGALGVGNRRDFAVVPVEGFNPERIRNLKAGMETTLGSKIVGAAVLDRDYRSDSECEAIVKACQSFCDFVVIHGRKEVENFLLVPAALDRAAVLKAREKAKRSGGVGGHEPRFAEFLDEFCASKKSFVASRILADRRRFERTNSPGVHEVDVNEAALDSFEEVWRDPAGRLNVIPGKEAFGAVNKYAQDVYGINLTATAVIDAMRVDEVPTEMKRLVQLLLEFSERHAMS